MTKNEIQEEIAGLEQELARIHHRERELENRLESLYNIYEEMKEVQIALI